MSDKRPTPDQIKAATEAVEEANLRYVDAQSRASEARSAETAALNNLNEKQRELSRLFHEYVSASPRESDWWRKTRDERVTVAPA